jgi:hypothetical protein
MPRAEPQAATSASRAKHLEHLASAFAEYRRVSKPGQRVPRGLRARVAAALDVGVSGSAIQKACKLSWSQVTRWRSAARTNGTLAASAPTQVLSVVDTDAAAHVALHVGPWRINICRAAE